MESFDLNSIYVCVKDMNRAVSFYEKLFNKKVNKKDDRYSEFDMGKVVLGLYSPGYDGDKVKYGANCIPNFQVESVDEEYDRIKQFASVIDDEIMDLPTMKLFQLKDSEGNILELYSEKK